MAENENLTKLVALITDEPYPLTIIQPSYYKHCIKARIALSTQSPLLTKTLLSPEKDYASKMLNTLSKQYNQYSKAMTSYCISVLSAHVHHPTVNCNIGAEANQ